MVGVAYDCLANPLGAVRSTFEKAIASGSDPASFSSKDWGAVDLFRSFLYDDGGLSQVPTLNSSSIRWVQPNTLVRFRGMIQDMMGNEFYVGAYKDGSVWRTNKFTDVPQFPMDSTPDMRLWERCMIYCIPVPGQNSWTESPSEAVVYRSMDSATQLREKRQRVDAEATDIMDYDVSDTGIEGSPSPKKLKENGHSSLPTPSKRSITEGTSSSVIMVPDVDRDLLPCLIKIYDCPESDLKLNEVFEFVGVFTFDSEFKEDKDDSYDFANGFSEDVLVHLPPNKVPRLHCFIHRKLAVHDFLPCSSTIEVIFFMMRPSSLNALQASRSDNKTLEEIMRTRPWKGGQPAVTHRAIFRGLIKSVAQLEEAGIICGELDKSKISIRQGSIVTIRDEPQQNDFSQLRFREQIKIWVSKAFQVRPALHKNIEFEYKDFLKEILNAGDNFKQLESHPFLLSYERKAYFLLANIDILNNNHKDWTKKYRKKVTNKVEIYDKIGYEMGYSDVLRYVQKDFDYEENALGALLYSSNVIAHIEGHFGRKEKPPSIEDVGKKLCEFFPEMMLGFYKFVVNKGIDTRSEPRSVNLVD